MNGVLSNCGIVFSIVFGDGDMLAQEMGFGMRFGIIADELWHCIQYISFGELLVELLKAALWSPTVPPTQPERFPQLNILA